MRPIYNIIYAFSNCYRKSCDSLTIRINWRVMILTSFGAHSAVLKLDSNLCHSDLCRCPIIIGYVPFRMVAEKVMTLQPYCIVWRLVTLTSSGAISMSTSTYVDFDHASRSLNKIKCLPFQRVIERVVNLHSCCIYWRDVTLTSFGAHSTILNVYSNTCQFQPAIPTSLTRTMRHHWYNSLKNLL